MNFDAVLRGIRQRRYGLLRAPAELPPTLPADLAHALPELRDALHRVFAVSLLRAQDAPDADVTLSTLVCDPDALVASSAADAIVSLTRPPHPRALASLASQCPHAAARATLYAAIGARGSRDDLPTFTQALAEERDRAAYVAGLASLATLDAPGAKPQLFLWAMNATPATVSDLAAALIRVGDPSLLRAVLPWFDARVTVRTVPLPTGPLALRVCDFAAWVAARLAPSGDDAEAALDRFDDGAIAAARAAVLRLSPSACEASLPPQAVEELARFTAR